MPQPLAQRVVPVGPAPPAVLRRRLRRAYLLSRTRTVVLALNGVDVATVEGILDSIVAEHGTGFRGLLYRIAVAERPAGGRALSGSGVTAPPT